MARRLVAGVIGEFGSVAIRCAQVDFQLGNTLPQTDIPESDLDMKRFGTHFAGHRTVQY